MSEIPRVDKPWGYELHWAKTDRYVGKIIHIDKGHALSLQYHNKKDETIMLLSGKLLFEIQEHGKLVQHEVAPLRALSRDAGHGASHDRDRRLRRRRGLDAGARRCGALGRSIRAGREEVTVRQPQRHGDTKTHGDLLGTYPKSSSVRLLCLCASVID